MKKTTFLLASMLMIFTVFAMASGITSQTVINQETVNQINSYNISHDLPWIAKVDPKFEGNTIQKLSVMDGYKKLPKQFVMDIITKRLTTTNDVIMGSYTLFNPLTMNENITHSSYDLRNVNGVSYVTPVKDQGGHGTCWAFSTVETLESAMMKQGVVEDYPFLGATPILSTQFTAYHDVDWDLLDSSNGWAIQDSNLDVGGSQYFAMYNAIRYGTPPAVDFPYKAREDSPWIRWDPQTPDWKDHLVKPIRTLLLLSAPEESYYFKVDYEHYINAIKTMIKDYGSVSVAFAVPADFFLYGSGVYVPATPITYEGGHAVQIVGWKSNVTASNGVTYPLVWIVRNSWGTSWGMDGYWMQPAITKEEYDSMNVPDWKFSSGWFYVPIFTKTNSVNWQAADFNNDGVVNMTDYDLLMSALNKTNPSSSTIAKYDIGIPKDGRIDGNDVSEFMYLWNKAAAAH